MENNKLKKVRIKNRTYYYYFDDIIKLENFDLHNILIYENYMKRFWFMTFHIKL